jgi:NADH dehydrogenase FAD-containing subunit
VSATGHVVLIGAGHAHLHVIDGAARLRGAGLDVTLVAPATFDYSGTAAGVAVGALPLGAGRIDVSALARRRGVAHEVGRATGLDPHRRRVRLEDGSELAYTLVSLNIGSVTDTTTSAVDGAVATKPLAELQQLRDRMAELSRRSRPRVAVVGAGASGLELAGNIAARLGPAAQVTLFDPAAHAASGLPRAAAHRAVRLLRDRGVLPRAEGVRLAAADHVVTQRGREGQDLVIAATGLRAPSLITETGLGDARGVPVRGDLRHRQHDDVLAAGDCARFLPRPLPPLGVYGVRAGPVLLEGLIALQHGRRPPTFRPQRHALRILDLGDGRGLASRGRWWYEGRAALRLKRRIDDRWLARYR